MCLDNKYTKYYSRICSSAEPRGNRKSASANFGYVEGHHIIPRCICNSEQENDSKNIVFLTFREHILCHLLLCKMFTGSSKYKMQHAASAFSHNLNENQRTEKSKVNTRTLAILREEFVTKQRERQTGSGNMNYGGACTNKPEVRAKMCGPRENIHGLIGAHERTPEIIEKFRTSRVGKGTGERNSMADPALRKKVSERRMGTKIAINSQGVRKYVDPNNIPDGFVIP